MRRQGRICALQILYQMDVAKVLPVAGAAAAAQAVDQATDSYWRSFEAVDPAERQFAERLVRGAVPQMAALDEALSRASHHWKVERMNRVDRALLRLAAYEILHCPDIPPAASINEALEIAKRFCGGEAGPFINGILDQLVKLVDPEQVMQHRQAVENVVPIGIHAGRRRP